MLQKKGKIWYVVLNYKEGNKWKKKWISTGTPSAREAKRIEKDIEYKATEGIIKVKAEKDIPTLRAFFDQWMDVCVKPPSRKPAAQVRVSLQCTVAPFDRLSRRPST